MSDTSPEVEQPPPEQIVRSNGLVIDPQGYDVGAALTWVANCPQCGKGLGAYHTPEDVDQAYATHADREHPPPETP